MATVLFKLIIFLHVLFHEELHALKTDDYLYSIETEIIIAYSWNSTNTSIDALNIENNILDLIHHVSPEEQHEISIVIINDETLNILISIKTKHREDMNDLVKYIQSEEFNDNLQSYNAQMVIFY